MKRAVERGGVEVKRAYAKIGVLMASAARAGNRFRKSLPRPGSEAPA